MIKCAALFVLVGSASAFHTPVARVNTPKTALAVSYLDQLSQGGAIAADPSSVSAPVPAVSVAPVTIENVPAGLAHASIDYFSLDKLVGKGARTTADWGTPADASRKLADDGMLRSGSWYCSEGGWPSPNPKAHTEVFYVLEGHGMLGDADGAKHYFGPGDTVTIPKGHTGRWDVYSPIHKVWAVNAHDRIEETSTPIRVQVDHYHEFGPEKLTSNVGGYDPLYRSESFNISYNTFYDVGPTKVGVWTAGVGSISVQNAPKSFFHLLEGTLYVNNDVTGEAKRCVAGDTVMLPESWCGHIDVIEPVKKLYTVVE